MPKRKTCIFSKVRKVAEPKVPRVFRFFVPNLAQKFPRVFEKFLGFVSCETEITENSPGIPASFCGVVFRRVKKFPWVVVLAKLLDVADTHTA